jgi:putative ABC transport system permease protein
MNLLLRNLRYSLRTMVRNPGFSLVTLITLAVGIGANTAIFSIVNAFLLRPLPFQQPEQLVEVHALPPSFDRSKASYQEFLLWRQQNRVFSRLTGLFETTFSWTKGGDATTVQGAMVSEGYFETFGTEPLFGRTFRPEEHKDSGNVVILSEHFWFQSLGGSKDIIGQSLMLDGIPYVVVGIVPDKAPDFRVDRQTSLWVPLEPNKPMYSMNPLNHYVRVFARLKDGVPFEKGQSSMAFLAKEVTGEMPILRDAIVLESLQDVLVGHLRNALLLLLGTVIFLLLIACANIANLFMIRAVNQRKDMAVRRALGASRTQLVVQMLVESLFMTSLGGLLGILLAVWTMSWLLRFWPANVSRPFALGIDWHVLGFAAAISLATGLLFGLGPALISSRVPPLELLNQGSAQAGSRQGWFCNFVVASEFALALLLMIGAGLMVKSFTRLQHVDPGFDARGVLTAQIDIPQNEFRQGDAIFRAIIERLQTLPGVETVGATSALPLAKDKQLKIRVEGRVFHEGEEPVVSLQLVTPGFFRAMHTPLLAGRAFTELDTLDAPHVVIVNQTLAQRFWPKEIAIGKHLDTFLFGNAGWQDVVGVVADVRTKELGKPAGLEVYVPYTEFNNTNLTITARANLGTEGLESSMQKAVWSVHPGIPVKFSSMENLLSDSVSGQRTAALLPSFFALCGLVLSCVGIYGVTSYVIVRRTREIGIRIALGATPGEVLLLILRYGLSLTLLGGGVGLVGAFVVTRLLSRWLYGVSPGDPQTFLIACAALAAVAALATYVPARRAASLNPMIALREE